MKNKNLVIGVIVAVAVVIFIMVVVRPSKTKVPGPQPAAKAVGAKAQTAKVPVQKVFTKGMGGLTVRLTGAQNREIGAMVRAFKTSGARSGVLIAAFPANRMYELVPGNYDIVIDTMPQMLYKNISVGREKESVVDLFRPTGGLVIKILASNKKEGSYPVRVLYPGSKNTVLAASTSRPIEVVAGVYDVEIGVVPRIVEAGVKIEAGKDKVLDLGAVTGGLNVKADDDTMQAMRYPFRLKKQGKDEVAAVGMTGRPLEVLAGTYTVELLSNPPQTKGDIKVTAGEQAEVEFKVAAPAPPAKPAAPAAPARPMPPAAAKAAPAPARK